MSYKIHTALFSLYVISKEEEDGVRRVITKITDTDGTGKEYAAMIAAHNNAEVFDGDTHQKLYPVED